MTDYYKVEATKTGGGEFDPQVLRITSYRFKTLQEAKQEALQVCRSHGITATVLHVTELGRYEPEPFWKHIPAESESTPANETGATVE